MTTHVDAVVVGAGVVGLACARSLAKAGHEVVVLDSADAIGTQNSSRNSEVVHAGLYYPPGSTKARHCRPGRDLVARWCATRDIAFRTPGKVVVAADEDEMERLEDLLVRAHTNGATECRLIDADELRAIEPAVKGVGALHSPLTGIVDSHGLMESLRQEAETDGAVVALRTTLTGARPAAGGWAVNVGPDDIDLTTRLLVNAAGLGARDAALRIEGLAAEHVPEVELVRGCYFSYRGPSPFRRLVYPMPGERSLGIHATHDLAGELRFGPDAEVVATPDFHVPPERRDVFAEAIRRYWPDVEAERLTPGFAGVRTRVRPDDGPSDFVIQTADEHGLPGLVNLFGLESPGLTAALSIAGELAQNCE